MQQKLTAIVVDDDIDLVSVFCEYLKIMDVDVVGRGYDGKEAVDLYEQKRPDIVFLDLSMPQYDGIFAVQRIKEANPDANLVVLTAYSSEDVRKKVERLGSEVIIKPFEMDKVMDVIENVKNQVMQSPSIHRAEKHILKEVPG
ncbi:MAG TPA: response regulator [Candidatus Nitrosotenuis sp.]